MVQQPADLGARKVGADRQPRLAAKQAFQPIVDQALAQGLRAHALPDDGIVQRAAGAPVPDHGRFALVGDPHAGDGLVGGPGAGGDLGLGQRRGDDAPGVVPDLERVVFDPARLGIDLLVFLVLGGDDLSAPVKHDAARAGGALVDGDDGVHDPLRFKSMLSPGL